MKIVIDTNIIFSILLTPNSKLRIIFFDENHEFYAPNFILNELSKHKNKLLKYSSLSRSEFDELLYQLFKNINLIDENFLSFENRKKAYQFCKNVDEDDIPFIALSLELNIPLWTGDKKLINGLKNKGFKFFS